MSNFWDFSVLGTYILIGINIFTEIGLRLAKVPR